MFRAAGLQEKMTEQRFSVPSAPTKTAATQRTSQRAERAIRQRDARAEPKEKLCLRFSSPSTAVLRSSP
jgi:hypothetical protein